MADRHGEFESIVHWTFAEHRHNGSDATEFFNFDPKVIAEDAVIAQVDELKEVFDTYLSRSKVDVVKQSTAECTESTPEAAQLAQQYRVNAANIKLLEFQNRNIALKLMGLVGSHAGLQQEGRERPLVSWKEMKSKRFDSSRFRKEHSKLYEEYLKETSFRRFSVNN